MKRGDVWWMDCEPAGGGEARQILPAVIVSNDAANQALSRVQVVPLTSNTENLYPGEARVVVDGKSSKAMADQIMTASKQRLRNRLGSLSRDDMRLVERAIKIQLGIAL